MEWEMPTFEEIKMDAEINSYQEDFEQIPDAIAPSAQAVTSITLQPRE